MPSRVSHWAHFGLPKQMCHESEITLSHSACCLALKRVSFAVHLPAHKENKKGKKLDKDRILLEWIDH